jgi:Ni/Co efflux regulator RcnB
VAGIGYTRFGQPLTGSVEQGQQRSKQNGQAHTQPQWTEQNGKPQGQQQWSQQNGQPRYQGGNGQSQQQWSQQHGQQRSDTHRYNWASYVPGQRPPQWEQYHRDFDPRAYQWSRYSQQRYHWEPYRPPHGWYYRQWTYGQDLPAAFWARDYWINIYWNFGLIDPPYGYVWVRYGPDALLVNVATGEILSVEYGVFYT